MTVLLDVMAVRATGDAAAAVVECGEPGRSVEERRHLIIRLGSQSAIWGKAITMQSATTWSAMKGQME